MSDPGVGHIRHSSLEHDKGVGYVWPTGKLGGPNMSVLGVGHVRKHFWNSVWEAGYIRILLGR
jgi:hypothetical protein